MKGCWAPGLPIPSACTANWLGFPWLLGQEAPDLAQAVAASYLLPVKWLQWEVTEWQ